jgi:hypothetical protein
VSSEQLGRHQQDSVSQGLERRSLPLWGQAESLEPVHEIVREQAQMEGGLVGEAVAGGNAAQGVIAFECWISSATPARSLAQRQRLSGCNGRFVTRTW